MIRSVAHAQHSIGSVLELVHLFRVFGFSESFVHHVAAKPMQSDGKRHHNNKTFSLLPFVTTLSVMENNHHGRNSHIYKL